MKISIRLMGCIMLAAILAIAGCGGDSGVGETGVGETGVGGTQPNPDAEAVSADAAALDADDFTFAAGDSPTSVTADFTMPISGANGTTITWAEKTDDGNTIALSGTGNATGAVTWPEANGFDLTPLSVTLTATITKGTEQAIKDIELTIKPTATPKVTLSADSVTFKMVLVPGGKTFPTGTNDGVTATVTNAYWIGETEVTYELWKKVYDWATDAARGANIYTFANAGIMGDGTGDTDQHPVTTVNWRDAMVWCNALTEWYNAQKGTSYECVYTYSGSIIRDSHDSNGTACDGAVASSTAKGFRLLTKDEWELAARWRNDDTNTVAGYSNPWFTRGNSASGATADYNDSDATRLVAVYNPYPGTSTAAVKSKCANALGLFDMSGNVWEWCFDSSGSYRVIRGGCWINNAYYLQVGHVNIYYPYQNLYHLGFRFAKTQ